MKAREFRKTRLIACVFLCLASNTQASGLAESADAILLNMLGAVGAAQDYEARFIVQTQTAGHMHPAEGLIIKQRREPSCLYMQWLDGPRQSSERLLCSDEATDNSTVRTRARTLMNHKALAPPQINALQTVLRPVQDEGLYGLVARYANQYFDAAQNAQPGDFMVELRQATVFNQPSSCLRIRRRHPLPDTPFQGQSEMCIYDHSKLPSTFRNWDANGVLLESYLIGDYRVNNGFSDADFKLGIDSVE